MVTRILGIVIGAAILAAGLYYLIKEKNDPQSRKIYLIMSLIGGGVAVLSTVLLVLLLV